MQLNTKINGIDKLKNTDIKPKSKNETAIPANNIICRPIKNLSILVK